jgi:hypothetical protein
VSPAQESCGTTHVFPPYQPGQPLVCLCGTWQATVPPGAEVDNAERPIILDPPAWVRDRRQRGEDR